MTNAKTVLPQKKPVKTSNAGRKALPLDQQVKVKYAYLTNEQFSKVLQLTKTETLSLAIKKLMKERGVQL